MTRKIRKPAIDRLIEMADARPIATEGHLLPMIDPFVDRRPAGAPGTVGRLVEIASHLVASLFDDTNRTARGALSEEAAATLVELHDDLASIQAMSDYRRADGRGYETMGHP